MANQLKMALVDTIQRLHQQGWSKRRIARELGIDRETVARHLAAKPASAEGALRDAKPATLVEALSADADTPASIELNSCSQCTTAGETAPATARTTLVGTPWTA